MIIIALSLVDYVRHSIDGVNKNDVDDDVILEDG